MTKVIDIKAAQDNFGNRPAFVIYGLLCKKMLKKTLYNNLFIDLARLLSLSSE